MRTLRYNYIALVLDGVAARGIDALAIAQRLGLVLPSSEPNERAPTAALYTFWEEALAQGLPWAAPLCIAALAPVERYEDLTRFIFCTAPTTAAALRAFQAASPITSPDLAWEVLTASSRAYLIPLGVFVRPGARADLLFQLGMITAWSRSVGAPLVELLWSEPIPDDLRCEAELPVSRVSPFCALTFSAPDTPHATPNPDLHAYFVAQAQDLLRGASAPPVITRLLLVFQSRAEHRWTLREAAAALGIAPRTLHRHLAERGASFQSLFDQHRAVSALRLLAALPDEEIAARFGYAEARSFRRAFRRWTGRPPGAFRRELA